MYTQFVLLICSIFYGLLFQLPEEAPTHPITARFSPHSLQPHISPFKSGLQIKGSLLHESNSYPCSIYLNEKNSLSANQDYLLQGQLKKRGAYDFIFKPISWEKIPSTYSLAELRYTTKEKWKQWLHTHLASSKVAKFLSAMTTGDVEERLFRYEFGKLGLQHILAISGFHFAILIAFITFFLRLFLSHKWKIGILFCCISTYFLFLGSSPAIERSYLTALFYLLGQWLQRPTNGLNLLGCALCAEVIYNPPVAIHLGFQFSFLSCFAILLLSPLIDQYLQKFSPKRSMQELKKLPLFHRYGAYISSLIRQSTSLTFAINITLLPLTLFHFHQFPLLGLLYNLFFPFCTGGLLFLLFISSFCQILFPPLSVPFFWLTNYGTEFLLQLTEYPPLLLSYSIQTDLISPEWVIAYLLGLSLFTITRSKRSYAEEVV